MFVIIKYKAQFSLQNRIQDEKFCIKSELQLFADVNYAALRGKVANDGLIFNSIGWNQVLTQYSTYSKFKMNPSPFLFLAWFFFQISILENPSRK